MPLYSELNDLYNIHILHYIYNIISLLHIHQHMNSSVQFISVAQLCPTLCDPLHCNTAGLPVHDQLPEHTQTHVYSVGNAIQPSHPLLSPFPPAFNLSQHQGLFK